MTHPLEIDESTTSIWGISRSKTLYCEEQQTFATKLDRTIQDKQARKLEVDTNFSRLKLELAQLQAEQLQTQISNGRANIVHREIQAAIDSTSFSISSNIRVKTTNYFSQY